MAPLSSLLPRHWPSFIPAVFLCNTFFTLKHTSYLYPLLTTVTATALGIICCLGYCNCFLLGLTQQHVAFSKQFPLLASVVIPSKHKSLFITSFAKKTAMGYIAFRIKTMAYTACVVCLSSYVFSFISDHAPLHSSSLVTLVFSTSILFPPVPEHLHVLFPLPGMLFLLFT